MRATTRTAATVAAVILLAGVSSCYYIPTGSRAIARAAITARDIPANIASIALIVTGPGMLPIQESYPPTAESVDVDVLAGPDRTFTLLLTTSSATLKAETTVDLRAGEIRQILFTPKLAGTDIVIPDAQNNRIVQVSDMTGAGWIAKGYADFGGSITRNLQPWDIDFDDRGRIYIANTGTGSAIGGVIRIDDIAHVSPTGYVNIDTAVRANTLAVDRANGYVYYTTGSSPMYRKNINSLTVGTDAPDVFDLFAESGYITNFGTTGIAVDRDGYVYITNSMTSDVLKYDPRLPAGSRVVASTTAGSGSPWDVMVKDDMVVVSGSTPKQLWFFDRSLSPLAPPSYGGPGGDPFLGPERFLGAADLQAIHVVDEDVSVVNRLVFLEDSAGTGWTTYGSTGAGAGQFNFFY
jgi:hypothetical protein